MISKRTGFTLVELMVVVLIVAILAAVAIPMMQGRINSAKWSEGKAGGGSIATALRAYANELKTAVVAAPDLVNDLGFAAADLNGTYFSQANYAVTDVSYTNAGGLNGVITVTAPAGLTPATNTLTITNNVASWAW